MDFELPKWSGNLVHLYCRLRIGKRNKTLKRMYYRKIEKVKLDLAERGIDQEKIKAVCRYLISNDCMRGANLKSCRDLEEIVISPDKQLSLQFHKNRHLPPGI